MNRRSLTITAVVCGLLGAVGAAWLLAPGAQPLAKAADHNDPPGRVMGASADRAADIGDLYVFTRGENTVFVMTLAGPAVPVAGQTGTYDRDVLAQIWYDEDGFGTGVAPKSIDIRFAQNTSGNWGMQVTGFPGTAGAVSGPVERQNMVTGGGRYWAGLRDDPFFFDGTGFGTTLMTGELSFDATRDSFAGQNITAIVVEVPNTAIDSTFDAWATTSRIGS
ncbi:MAG: DUF4331 family protein [Sandaracinaceae bacterium]|nr:DUF4331 family protein [Sandaracinaceae bacterium]